MKAIARTVLNLQMTVLLVGAALTSPITGLAAAEKERPFHGNIEAVEIYNVFFPALLIDTSGAGDATHLGHFTISAHAAVNLLDGSGQGEATFEGANGDQLFTKGTGQFSPTSNPEIALVTENFTITGGTGRFTCASGSFTVERVLNPITGVTSGSLDGTILFQKK